MTPEQFAYWFQGFAELSPEPPSATQWQAIRDHLATVFKKVTPPLGSPLIPPATPEQKKVSDDVADMIRRYEEAARKGQRPPNVPWQPCLPYPTDQYYLRRDTTGGPGIIC